MIGRVLVSMVVAAMITWCIFWAFGALMFPDPGLGPAPVRNTSSFADVETVESSSDVQEERPSIADGQPPLSTDITLDSSVRRNEDVAISEPNVPELSVNYNVPGFDSESAEVPEPEPPD